MKVLELDILFNYRLYSWWVGAVVSDGGEKVGVYSCAIKKRAQKIKLDFFEVSLVRQNANNVF